MYERRLENNDCGAQCFINGPTDKMSPNAQMLIQVLNLFESVLSVESMIKSPNTCSMCSGATSCHPEILSHRDTHTSPLIACTTQFTLCSPCSSLLFCGQAQKMMRCVRSQQTLELIRGRSHHFRTSS